ncbi:hypothetical protein KP509_15G018300 [Ceratopteris richardii]|uniref:TIR domain-containing protein n=2 Tax=Ceratopteris richardii TaxID=49495 RepID=A0A8T2T329_CERRI|nr:hypothetical protein KP509_15G018300 [Ceratopteris richardii]KAH7404259.1 hypothetical protein KP509_15G018300 [Ceratopteris richardii]
MHRKYDVIICQCCPDTKRGRGSALRGMLRSRGITSFVHNAKGSEGMHHIDDIKNSMVYIFFLSRNFSRSRCCLEKLVEIMKIQGQFGRCNNAQPFLPVFCYDDPNQERDSSYNLSEVPCTTDEERKCWSEALQLLFGCTNELEYCTQQMSLYEILKKIVADVERLIEEVLSRDSKENLYAKEIYQLHKALNLEELKSVDVSVVGIHSPENNDFVDRMIHTFSSHFEAWCKCNVINEASRTNSLKDLIQSVFPELALKHTDDIRRLVVFHNLGNSIEQIKELLQLMRKKLTKSSVVIVMSQFRHILCEAVKVEYLIDLFSLRKKNRGELSILFGNGDQKYKAFVNLLQESFCVRGLDVRMRFDESLCKYTSCPNVTVISSGTSSSSNISDNRVVLELSQGPQFEDKSMSNIRINFEAFKQSTGQLKKGEFEKMVNEVVQAMDEEYDKLMPVTDFAVGLMEWSNKICSRISICMSRSNISLQCFGLVGIGGVGKTTLAESIYNIMLREFEVSIFLSKIRENASKHTLGLVDMQKKILDMVLRCYNKGQINDLETGKSLLSHNLEGINALIILDDVDDISQLHALYYPLCSSLGPKSIIIITTRDHQVLEFAQAREIFEMKGLNRTNSERLLCWHAYWEPGRPKFLKGDPPWDIDACIGLPLLLKQIGDLYHNDENSWDQELCRLRKSGDIFNVSRISFEGLKANEKDAFLDVCCFLLGEEEEIAYLVLESCHGMGWKYLNTLRARCLITVDGEDRRIGMHQHLRDMGRHIVRQGKRNRAWDEEIAKDILKDKWARSALHGLSMDIDKCFLKEDTERISLPQLKILLLKGDAGDRTFPEKVSCENLRWLQWRCCPFPQLPDRLCSQELRVLDLSFSNIKDVPESLPNLLVLDLTGTKITELPDHFRSPSLRVLRLSRTEISKVPVLQNLETLELHSCKKFRGEFLYLPSLRHSGLSNCNDLTFLDVCNGGMTDLRYLDLRSSGLSTLHKKMMKLLSLEVLDLRNCTSLETLSFLPTTLHKLWLNGCSSLETVDTSLPTLQELHVNQCRKLKTLPRALGTSIKHLDLAGCAGLEPFLASNQASFFGGETCAYISRTGYPFFRIIAFVPMDASFSFCFNIF